LVLKGFCGGSVKTNGAVNGESLKFGANFPRKRLKSF
jgi:hypothetical protein